MSTWLAATFIPAMKESRLIIRSHAPVRLSLIAGVALIVVVFACLVLYNTGQSRAGFNAMDAQREQGELRDAVSELRAERETLQDTVAQLETAAKIDREAYALIEDELVDLRTQILEQQEDLAFYKGIVAAQDEAGVRVQDFKLLGGLTPGQYIARVVLAQEFRSDRQVSGKLGLKVEGKRGTAPAIIELNELKTDSGTFGQVNFKFRYFQDIKAEFELPEGFQPQRVILRITPSGKTSKTVEEFYDWALQSG
ncbi:MAG: DUF6776 family protein [Gammaproteobacteria bacterium]